MLCLRVQLDVEPDRTRNAAGSLAGRPLTIFGRGFVNDTASLTVLVGGQPCAVQAASAFNITCRAPAAAQEQAAAVQVTCLTEQARPQGAVMEHFI